MTDLANAALVVVDWGTSRLRAMLVDAAGGVLAEAESNDGIGSLTAGGHEAAFERAVRDWPQLPAVMAGMIGSRQGWHEAQYLECPATPQAIAAAASRFTTSTGRDIVIVPGLMLRAADRDGDVMRGEETQIIGLLEHEPGFAGVAILPGTHSKWALVGDGSIAGFQTFLTGELFELLSRHSFLRHSVRDDGRDLSEVSDFRLAVERTAVEGLPFLAAIFSVRARQLLGAVQSEDNLAYLSGLVIGAEIAAARVTGHLERRTALRVVGTRSLARAYRKAFEVVGWDCQMIDGSELAVRGLVRVARAIGFLPEQR